MSMSLRFHAMLICASLLAIVVPAYAGAPGPTELDSRTYMESYSEMTQLVSDAKSMLSKRDWTDIGFEIWTSYEPGGRGVQLATTDLPAISDAPGDPARIKVGEGTLRSVVGKYLGRTDIEIDSHYNAAYMERDGVFGFVAAVERSANGTTRYLYFAPLTPLRADQLAREIASHVWWRDIGAAGRMRDALDLSRPALKASPLAVPKAPTPWAIYLSPTVRHPDSHSLLLTTEAQQSAPVRAMSQGADYDRSCGHAIGPFFSQVSAEQLRTVAAVVQRAASGKTSSGDKTWTVRVYDRGGTGQPVLNREFRVSARLGRSCALEAFDGLSRGHENDNTREVLRSLADLDSDLRIASR